MKRFAFQRALLPIAAILAAATGWGIAEWESRSTAQPSKSCIQLVIETPHGVRIQSDPIELKSQK